MHGDRVYALQSSAFLARGLQCQHVVDVFDTTNLVDPASSHMLVSKIKPCMSKYTLWHSETANGSLNQLWFIGLCLPMWITVVILELIHASIPFWGSIY